MKAPVIIVAMLAAFLLTTTVSAVEVRKTEKPLQEKPVQVQKPEPQKTEADVKKDTSSGGTADNAQKPVQKDFDNFVDRNNNGIDDRAEQKHEKPTPEKQKAPAKDKNPSDSL
ncbi:MAG: hypothetical protein JW763_04285 [candidate division Zixibacteria bacterium]|nr:hypothetical protein [candidate division Zixibacteria bacterium]